MGGWELRRGGVLTVLLAFSVAGGLCADDVIEAYTIDGEGVLLYEDGPWEYSGKNYFFDVEQNQIESVDDIEISELLRCVVTEVKDGDTLVVEFEHRPPGILREESVRLLGIDTPELRGGEHPELAEEARRYVARHVAGATVYLAFESEWRDSFGRLLAYVFTSSGTLLNAALLSEGLAKVYRAKPCHFHNYFVALESSARVGEVHTDIVIRYIFNEGRTEYVELWNSTDSPVTLDGWYIRDAQYHVIDIPPGTSIPAGGSLYVLSGIDTDAPSENYVYPTRALIWNNSGDEAYVYDEDNELVAEYSY